MLERIKQKMKEISKCIIAFFIMIILFCSTLTLSSLIPKKCIEEKVSESAKILEEQTDRLYIPIHLKSIYMLYDNFTDALMINTAFSIDSKTPFYSAIVARKNYIEGTTKKIYPDTIGELKSSSKHEDFTQVGDLVDTVNNDTEESFEYARYWHGYLIFLRPLLIVFNVAQIRILLFIIFLILAIILLYKIYKRINIQTAVIFLFGLIICDYFFESLSLQGSAVFLITMITSILIFSKDFKNKAILYFIVGGLTSFFDFLTVPIITLGIPLLIDIMISENKDFKTDFKTVLKNCIMWAIGYSSVFISKWVITDIIYNKGLINTTIEQLKYRTLSNGDLKDHISIIDAIFMNFKLLLKEIYIALLFTVIMVLIKFFKKDAKTVFNYKKMIIYWMIGFLGIMWYVLLKEHSYQHYYFTYRNCFLIVVAFFIGIYNGVERVKDEEKNK